MGQDAPPVALGARTITVGAHASCDLVLTDAQVSRKHAELAITPEGIRVKDLGSTNGTWCQGTRIGEVVVPGGATIKFGNTPVRISGTDTPSLPPSERDHFGAMAGQSVAMRELFAVLELAAPSDATVLDRRRVRHRQGARGAGDPRRVVARRRPVRRRRLRRDLRER